MRENVGRMDARIRIAAGGALAVAGIVALARRKLVGAPLLASGALLLDTAITHVCPVNAMLGLDTRSEAERAAEEERAAMSVGGDAAVGPVEEGELLEIGVLATPDV